MLAMKGNGMKHMRVTNTDVVALVLSCVYKRESMIVFATRLMLLQGIV